MHCWRNLSRSRCSGSAKEEWRERRRSGRQSKASTAETGSRRAGTGMEEMKVSEGTGCTTLVSLSCCVQLRDGRKDMENVYIKR